MAKKYTFLKILMQSLLFTVLSAFVLTAMQLFHFEHEIQCLFCILEYPPDYQYLFLINVILL